MTPARVGIVGLGLIGGSLARDLAGRGMRVLGYDADPETLAHAIDSGTVAGTLGEDLEGVSDVDWLVLAVPVDVAPGVLERARPHLANLRLVTDTGSTKRGIVATAERMGLGDIFVGSHPFTGDHRAGWSASRQGLFDSARVFLCPTTDTSAAAMREAESLWSTCGGRTEVVTAEAHDRLMAWTSHLPQILSTSLGAVLAGANIAAGDAGRGARDMLRLAASAESVWTGIALDNADNLTHAMLELERVLEQCRHAIAAGDRAALDELFRTGRRDSLLE